MDVLDRAPVDRIRLGRVALTVVAAVLFGAGWVTAKALVPLWMVVSWSATAVRVGWQDASRRGPDGGS